jgi:hypothetical protein
MATNLGPSIKTAYFYVFSAIGIILLIVGIFKLSDFTVRNFFLDNYYLDYEAGRCSYLEPVKLEGQETTVNIDSQKRCEEDLVREREVKKVTDVASSITFIVVGTVLFVFHYRRARKLS